MCRTFLNFEIKKPKNIMLLSSVLGMCRTVLALPILHPCDVVKVNWQSNPHMKNEISVLRMIKAEKGIKGLYSGYATNMTKQLFKASYRYPLISGLPRFYSKLFGSKYEDHKYSMKLMTSVTIALVEAGLITPFERLQVFMMTSKFSNKNYSDFYHMVKSRLRTELFRGYTPYFTKQIVSWTAFLQADTFYKSQIRRIFEVPDDKMILGWKLALCTLLVSSTTIMCVIPFDNIKTFLQKHNLEVKGDKKVQKGVHDLNIKTLKFMQGKEWLGSSLAGGSSWECTSLIQALLSHF